MKRPFFKQKVALYFDENIPPEVISFFGTDRYWQKKVKVTSAQEAGNAGHDDSSHYSYCWNRRYTLVTLDRDFDDDQRFPFRNRENAGIIMLKASSADVKSIVDILSRVLEFVVSLPFPKGFLTETKFTAGKDSVVIRGRDASTKEIKTMYVTPGVTKMGEIREFFSY
jgi:predicted nuclease of predicted toxin-antitoxin system